MRSDDPQDKNPDPQDKNPDPSLIDRANTLIQENLVNLNSYDENSDLSKIQHLIDNHKNIITKLIGNNGEERQKIFSRLETIRSELQILYFILKKQIDNLTNFINDVASNKTTKPNSDILLMIEQSEKAITDIRDKIGRLESNIAVELSKARSIGAAQQNSNNQQELCQQEIDKIYEKFRSIIYDHPVYWTRRAKMGSVFKHLAFMAGEKVKLPGTDDTIRVPKHIAKLMNDLAQENPENKIQQIQIALATFTSMEASGSKSTKTNEFYDFISQRFDTVIHDARNNLEVLQQITSGLNQIEADVIKAERRYKGEPDDSSLEQKSRPSR